jgi:tetratricopeptide (TPR) repeat protein
MSSAQAGDPLAGSPGQNSEPLTGSPPVGDSGRTRRVLWPRRGDLAAWLMLGLAVAATIATLPLIWTPIRLQPYRSAMHPEWHLYLIGAQVLALPLFLLIAGPPRSPRGWVVLVISNLELAALAFLSALDLLNVAAVHVLVLGLRLTMLALWIFVLAGIPVVVWRLANRGNRPATALPLWAKVWFSALVLLLFAEPTAALLTRVLPNPNRLSFPKSLPSPPPGELHIAFVGESTMAGFPYLKFGIPKVVGWQLEQMYPDRKIVLDDVSAVGLNLRTALARLDRLTVRPEVLLLYSGHNEFFYDVEELATDLDTPWERFDGLFEWSPLFRLLNQRISHHIGVHDLEAEGARTLVDRPIASPEARAKRLARFEGQLEQLAQWCQCLEISELWFVPAGSEADYAPNRSCLDHLPVDSERQQLEAIELEGRSLETAGRWQEAGHKYQAALERHPTFAEFNFQVAECLMHEGKSGQAAPRYAQALECDGLPIRMIAPWRQTVTKVAERHAIPLIDSQAVLRPHTAANILDRSVFLDYVHPNLRGYYDLGMAAIERIRSEKALLGERDAARTPAHTDFASTITWAGFTAKDLAQAYRRTAEADRLMSRLRFESSRLTADSQRYQDWYLDLESGRITPGQSGTESLK